MTIPKLALKVIRLLKRKFSRTFWSMYVKGICILNGIKCKRIRALGCPYINVSRFGQAEIGDRFHIRTGIAASEVGSVGTRIIVRGKGVLKIGRNVGMTNATICVDQSVTIGDNVMIGGGVQIFDTNFHSLDHEIRASGKESPAEVKTSPVMIGNNVFIGANSIICKGVSIGDHAVIAAGSVVVRDIGANECHGGNPAAKIR